MSNKKRNAIRNFNTFQAHDFETVLFKQPTYCTFCKGYIWGFPASGCRCKYCFMATHKQCAEKVFGICIKNQRLNAIESSNTIKRGIRFKLDVAHKFKISNYFKLTFCDHCGTLLKGAFRQGYKCVECNFNCHESCRQNVARTCGIHENEIYKVLNEIPIRSKQSKNTQTVTLNDFQVNGLIGEGGYAKVYSVTHTNTKKTFALKVVQKERVLLDDIFEELLTEKEVWIKSSQSPFIIQLYCTFQCSKNLYFLIEYACDGDLMEQLNKNGGRFTEILTRFYTCEIICAIQYLHRNSIIYRDLKLENVLLTRDGHVKLTDFGMSKLLSDQGTTTFCGTAECMAPEIAKIYFAKKPQDLTTYNYMVDYFSLGVMIFHMITGFSPFNRDDSEREDILKSIISDCPQCPNSTSPDAQKCIYGLLEKDFKKRLGSDESPYGRLRDQSFFTNVEWDRIELGAIEPPLKPHYITLSNNSSEIKLEDDGEDDKFDYLKDIFDDFNFISEYFK